MTTSNTVHTDLVRYRNSQKAAILSRFFKTGKGGYGEGDMFLGIVVPDIRRVAKTYGNLEETEVIKLVKSRYHEERLTGLLIWVEQSRKAELSGKRHICDLYLGHTRYINNWDLVDLTAEHVVGPLVDPDRPDILVKLANSKSLWERRIAILSTFRFLKAGNAGPTLLIARILRSDDHDLIHKAVGWMLREVGKRCSYENERSFLDKYGHTLPRTMLRYAIERFPEVERRKYLKLGK